jgi:hypothetical protein
VSSPSSPFPFHPSSQHYPDVSYSSIISALHRSSVPLGPPPLLVLVLFPLTFRLTHPASRGYDADIRSTFTNAAGAAARRGKDEIKWQELLQREFPPSLPDRQSQRGDGG